MFFLFSKLLIFLLNPLIWIITSVVLFIFLKDRKWKKIMAYSSIVMFLFFSNGIIIGGFMNLWEVEGKRIQDIDQYDIGIVLSGMMDYNENLDRLSVQRGADRIWQAISLYKQKRIKKILISGDSGYILKDGLHESTQLRKILIEWGIPEDDIITEDKSRNTYENALYTAEILHEQYPNARLLLITSAMHMRRAAACFQNQDVKFDTFTTDHYSGTGNYFNPESLVPNTEAIHMWHMFNKEWMGYCIYWVAVYL